MSPSPSDRLIVDSTMAAPSPRGTKVYGPKFSKLWRLGLIGIGFGFIGLWALTKVLSGLATGTMPDRQTMLATLSILFLPFGIFWIANALRGRPRLTVWPEGILLEGGLGQKWAKWDSLDSFEARTTHTGRYNQRVVTGSARVVGPNTSKAGLKRFVLPDQFATPMDTMVAELNAARAATLGPRSVAAAAPAPAEFAVGLQSFAAPWLTLALLAVLLAVFAVENLFPVSPGSNGSPSVPTLLAMGGLSPPAVLQYGEWYRLFTAPLLHGGVLHILFNGVALLLGGRLLERLVGRLWFFAFFVVGALGGSLMSLAVNPANLVSVGASGALMGMFAALFVGAFHLPAHSPARQRLQMNSIQVLVPSLLPLASVGGLGKIDYGAHFGGAIAGALLAALLLMAWPKTNPLPRLRPLAAGISFLGFVLFGGSAAFAVTNYSRYDIVVIPPAQIPKTAADQKAHAADLAARYPKDPRSHLFLGEALWAGKDTAGAERELRTALAGAQAHTEMFPPELQLVIRGVLAGDLVDEGKRDDAKDMARPVCSAPPGSAETMKKVLNNQHLCD